LTGVPYVGDSLRDMQAAETVGCVPHLVRTGRYPDATALTLPAVFPVGTQVHADLAAFVDHLLGEAAAVRALS
jgi:D-glycero-D-manno-heptose 1,7-bisphosphate phosphatase